MPFIVIGNPKRRAVVSGLRFLALVRRKRKGRDHESGCGHNEFEMLGTHLMFEKATCRVVMCT